MNILLQTRKNAGILRTLNSRENLFDFASNDYLGLARNKQLKKKVLQEWSHYDCLGSTGSRLLTGNSPYAENLEKLIACYHGYENSLLFNSGFAANLGLLSSLPKNSCILFDSHVHASTRLGINLNQSISFPFRHHDLNHLEKRLLSWGKKGNCYVCVESIYSTDGSLAQLKEIIELCKQYQAHVIVDEAHAVGIFGDGKGLVAEQNLQSSIYAQVVTFGKALGAFGAAILGNQLIKEYLINFATSQVYSTSLPLINLIMIKSAYEMLPSMKKERSDLFSLVNSFQIQFPYQPKTHLQMIKCEVSKLKTYSELLQNKGFDVRPIFSPTVPKGAESLRICLHSFNTSEQLYQLIKVLKNE